MQCLVCQFENLPGGERCGRCGSALRFAGVPCEPPRAAALRLATRGARVRNRVRAALPTGGAAWRAVRIRVLDPIDWPTMLATLIPGGGHLRLGQRAAAGVLFGVWAVLLLAWLAWFGNDGATFAFYVAVGVHAAAFVSLLGGSLAAEGLLRRAVVGGLAYWAVNLVLYGTAGWLIGGYFRLTPIGDTAGTAVIRNGDVLVVDGPWLRPERFERGEIVLYSFSGNRGPGFITYGGQAVDRVIGVPGDEVRLDAGGLTVNGVRLESGAGPLNAWELTMDKRWKLRASEYLILPSTALRLNNAIRSRALADAIAAASVVPEHEIVGRARWRMGPWGRRGPLEQPLEPSLTP